MILLTDVGYNNLDRTAIAAGILIEVWEQERPTKEITVIVGDVQPYESGSFYKRELPCLRFLIDKFACVGLTTIVVDGYVDLSPGHPGLGRHLWENLPYGGTSYRPNIFGVAKTRFAGADHVEVLRGSSKQPLYVTACGETSRRAADLIHSMHGNNRIPTLLKRVDALSRGKPCMDE